MKRIQNVFKNLGIYYIALHLVVSFISLIPLLFGVPVPVSAAIGALLIFLFYVWRRKKLEPSVVTLNGLVSMIILVIFTVLMVLAKGNADGRLLLGMEGVLFPFVIYSMILSLMSRMGDVYVIEIAMVLWSWFCSWLLLKRDKEDPKSKINWKKVLAMVLAAVILISANAVLYINRPEAKYSGHGFRYMNGYSSTDFTDYTVYSASSKLAELDAPSEFTIKDKQEMPVMDGAEACYPLYAAVAKAVYEDIASIEEAYLHSENNNVWQKNGEIVQFTNTINGFFSLVEGRCDLFFGARPSEHQMDYAKDMKVDLTVTPIGREAFVFFVEEDNPISSLTSEQVRAIYHGDITNWSELGGKDQEIRAFQRPRDSGSQTMMEAFMGDVSLKEPETYEIFSSMSGVLEYVSQYHDEAGALGYSFRYFVEELSQEKNVKILAIDGVMPTLENIENGTYALTVPLCLVTRTDDPNPNVENMIRFMLSDQGQELVRKTGYGVLE